MGKVRNNADEEARERQSGKASKYKEAKDAARKTQQNSADDLETLFSMGSRSSSVPKSRAMTSDSMFDAERSGRGKAETVHKKVSGFSSGMSRASAGNMVDDLSSLFGVGGESEERPKARLGREQRTQDRIATVVADMNKHGLQTQHEQEERRESNEAS